MALIKQICLMDCNQCLLPHCTNYTGHMLAAASRPHVFQVCVWTRAFHDCGTVESLLDLKTYQKLQLFVLLYPCVSFSIDIGLR